MRPAVSERFTHHQYVQPSEKFGKFKFINFSRAVVQEHIRPPGTPEAPPIQWRPAHACARMISYKKNSIYWTPWKVSVLMMQSRIASTLQSSYRTSHRGLTTYCHIVPCILLLLMLMMRLAIQSGCYECRCHGPSCRWYLKLWFYL